MFLLRKITITVDISIHALLAESDLRVLDGSKSSVISIHALLAESDFIYMLLLVSILPFLSTLSLRRATNRFGRPIDVQFVFLSTLSLRRATWPGLLARLFFIISIHALLAESDYLGAWKSCDVRYFYPRSPCGERRPEYFLT